MVAVADPGLTPVPTPLAACTLKLKLDPGLNRFAAGVNRSPALPSAKVMKSPLLIGVAPSCLNSAPLVMFVILKCVISAPSTGLRLMTRPDVLWVSSFVVALVTEGVSPTWLTVNKKISVMLWLLASLTVTVMVDVPNLSATGLIIRVRVEPEPLSAMFAALFGTSVVFDDVAVTELIDPPRLKVN